MVGQAVLAVCVLCAGSIEAQEDASALALPSVPAWRIAPEVSRYRYEEPGVMTNEGTLYGVVGSYTFRGHRDGDQAAFAGDANAPVSRSTLRLDGRLSAGEVDYDGSFMDGTPLSTSGTDDFLLDVRLLWGREWQPARFVDGVYAGLGYRYLNDDSSAQIGGYMRESNYLYLPLGARKDFELAQRWDLSLMGEFDVLLIGRQISHLEDVDRDLPTVRNWQWPGFGVRLSPEFRRACRNFDFGFAPFLRYWWIAESDVSEDGYYEPENNTVEYGLSLVVRF